MDSITIRRVWHSDRPLRMDDLSGYAFSGEIGAHTFVISSESDLGLSGSVSGKMILADGTTVALTGSVEYGEAVLTLTEACYLVPGSFRLSIFVSSTGTSVCVYSAVGTVSRTDTDAVVDPSSIIPNLTALQTAAGLANAAAVSANAAATAANAFKGWVQEAKDGASAFKIVANEWELGNISDSNGNNSTSQKYIRSKNKITYDGVSLLQFNGLLLGSGETVDRVSFAYCYENSTYKSRVRLYPGVAYDLPPGTNGYRLTYGYPSADTSHTISSDAVGTFASAYDMTVYSKSALEMREDSSIFRTEHYTELLDPGAFVAGMIVFRNGNNYSSSAYCRTGLISLKGKDDVLIRFNSREYKWISWNYNSTSSAVDTGTHANTGNYAVRAGDTIAKYQTGDKAIRLAFCRVDGENLTTSGDGNDWDKIRAALELRYIPASLNFVNLDEITDTYGHPGDAEDKKIVSVTREGPDTITLETVNYCDYSEGHPELYVKNMATDIATGLKLERGETYLIRLRVDSITLTGVAHTPKFRFYGTAHKSSGFSIGIDGINKAGEYAALIRASGYEKGLMFQLNGGKSGYTKVTLSNIMLAKVSFSMPYVPYGKSRDLALAGEGASGDRRSQGISNMVMHSAQLSQLVWNAAGILPCQWDAAYTTDDQREGRIPEGKSVGDVYKNHYAIGRYMGAPYSSARMVDKMIGIHVSPWTFKTAVADPRSVLYERVLKTGNGKTFYGIVCSTYVSHNIGERRNLTTADMRAWDQLEDVDIGDIRVGDFMLSDKHVETIMEIARDKHGRIIGVTFTDSGKYTAKINNAWNWEDFKLFVANLNGSYTGLHPYVIKRYKKLGSIEYKREPITIGYPEETEEARTIPKIMSEYGDRAVLLAGETCNIHILTDDANASVTGTLDGEAITIPTIQTLAARLNMPAIRYFPLMLSAGLYTITMTYTEDGVSHTDTSYLYVCDGSVSKNGSTLTITGTNCVPVGVTTYPNRAYDNDPVNHATDYVEGQGAVSGQSGTWTYAIPNESPHSTDTYYKVFFRPTGDYSEWGQATWYCAEATEESTPGDIHSSYQGSMWRETTAADYSNVEDDDDDDDGGDDGGGSQ